MRRKIAPTPVQSRIYKKMDALFIYNNKSKIMHAVYHFNMFNE